MDFTGKFGIFPAVLILIFVYISDGFLLPTTSHAHPPHPTAPRPMSGAPHSGHEFYMTFGTNFYPYAFRKFVQIMIHSNTTGIANIYIPFQKTYKTIDIQPGQTLYNLSDPSPLDPYNLEIKQKGIYLISTAEINVFLVNHGGSSTDGFLVYPLTALSVDYVISTSQPYISRPYNHFQSEVAILSTMDNNHVTIKLRLLNGSIEYNNRTYTNGDMLNLTLNRLDTFQIYHPWDMSGTRIRSNYPIAVISGNRCNVFEIYNGCDHFSEMMPPVSKLSQSFIVPEFYDYYNWTIQVVATVDHTHVNIMEKDGEIVSKNLNANEVLEVVVINVTTVQTSKPVLATQYVHGIHVLDNFDPFMVLCQWVDSFQREYDIIVPGLDFESYLAMTVESSDLSSIMIDGSVITNPLDILGTTEVSFHGKLYSVFSVEVTPGPHTIKHKDGGVFGLVIYGNQLHDSYGFLGGLI